MATISDDDFAELFLHPDDLPTGLTLSRDFRAGQMTVQDIARPFRCERVGRVDWDGPVQGIVWMVSDMRELFPDAGAASAYHRATLQERSVHDRDCHPRSSRDDDKPARRCRKPTRFHSCTRQSL